MDQQPTADPEEAEDSNLPNGRRWRDIFVEKFLIAVLAAATLGIVNHLFWQRQEQAKKKDFYFQEKTKVYSLVSSNLTELITDINARIEQNKEPDSAKKTREISRLDGKIDADNAQLGVQFSYVKVYFRAEALKKVDECRDAIARVDRSTTEYLRRESELGQCAQGLADLLAAETRQEFSEFNSR